MRTPTFVLFDKDMLILIYKSMNNVYLIIVNDTETRMLLLFTIYKQYPPQGSELLHNQSRGTQCKKKNFAGW